jgi:hypothetical protein
MGCASWFRDELKSFQHGSLEDRLMVSEISDLRAFGTSIAGFMGGPC